ncbi:hypothetical protein KKJ09_13605 [Xenorhabdus bovienii]|uniref:hypothetical protein n=1 Tax=Xenorhabdus bovienii TaxID=40576 RepID=UPI0023B2BD7D|nr:hypothetical protein [Xenorhabdus bovienii]MDE9494592.1 hypothetical protein [Xenorhabdus bovienii]MDE9502989.1 hypothetical protein [Xenorhabdus bovienii]MDE9526624.1 hypothetical protein [Xenorhabdus bovienii]
MYIYSGEISVNTYITREELVLIIPNEMKIGTDVIVIYKCSSNKYKEKFDQEKNMIGVINSIEKIDEGVKIHIQYNQDYYSDIVISEDQQSIKITMYSSGVEDSLIKSILYRVHENNTKIQTNLSFSSLSEKSLSNDNIGYCQLINDTNNIYFCHLSKSSSAEEIRSTISGAIGLAYSFVGLATTKFPYQVGVTIGIHSILYATFTTIWDKLYPAPPAFSRAVLPGHSITRKAGFFQTNLHDLILTRMKIKQEPDGGKILSVETATKEKLAHEKYIITNIEKEVKWQTVLNLVMDSPHTIVPSASVTIDKFIVYFTSNDLVDIHTNLISYKLGTWFSYKEKKSDDEVSPKASKFEFKDWKKEVNLEYKEENKSSFIYMPSKETINSANSDSAVVEIINYKDPNKFPKQVLRLKGYRIESNFQHNNTSLGNAGGQTDVLDKIGNNPNYIAYLWDGRGNSVTGYKEPMKIKNENLKIKKIKNENSYVYLWVQEITPYLILQGAKA